MGEAPVDGVVTRPQADLYETDFYAWSLRQATLLGSGDFAAVDLVNVVEEIESLGRAQIDQAEDEQWRPDRV